MKEIKSFLNKRGRGFIALFVIGVLIASIYTPISTEAASLKEEVVYVRLNNDGSVSKVYVINSFQLGENREIIDYGNYEYVKNLSDSGIIKLEDGTVTVNAQGDQLYYEGFLVDPQLPWNISITYMLDGQIISAEELSGQTGQLVIHIETGPNPLGDKEFYESYALQLSLMLKSRLCRNILAEGGTVSTAGDNKQISFVILPGKPTLIELSADVENFEMPAMTIAGVRLNMDFAFEDTDMSDINKLVDGITQLDDGVQELLDGVFDMHGGVSDLHDGTIELSDGVGEFKDGIQELSEGTGELKDGVSELKDGTSEMSDGALELADGVTELVDGVRGLDDGVGEFADGIDQLYDGIGELKKGTLELYSGMSEIIDGSGDIESGAHDLSSGASSAASGGKKLVYGFSEYYDGIIDLVNAELAGLGLGLPVLTRDNYETVIESVVYGQAISQARQTVKDQVYAAAQQNVLDGVLINFNMTREQFDVLPKDNEVKILINQTLDSQLLIMQDELAEQVELILNANMPDILEKVAENPQAQQLLGLREMIKGYDMLLAGLTEYVSGVDRISSGTRDFYAGISEFKGGLQQYRSGMSEYVAGIDEFYEESYELVDGANKLKEGTVELLDGVIELNNGIIEFKDGTIELHDGVIKLFDGIVELHDGVIEIYDGTIELNDGVIQLVDGTKALLDGSKNLYDGVVKLKDGTGDLQQETSTMGKDIIDVIKDKINEMLGGDTSVKSFVSKENGEILAVQFVMQTEGISIPEVETEEAQPESELTFWQRFIKLFDFMK